jgi:hypothetical protein
VVLRHSRFKHRICKLCIDLHDAIHAAEVDHHIVISDGLRRTIAPVLAGADRIQRHVVRIGDLNDLLDLLDRSRTQDPGDIPLDGNGAPTVFFERRPISEDILVLEYLPELVEHFQHENLTGSVVQRGLRSGYQYLISVEKRSLEG